MNNKLTWLFIISSLFLSWGTVAQEKEEVKPKQERKEPRTYALRAGIDLYKPIRSQFDKEYQGLEIVGVSLDKNQSSWARAIEDDGLSWNHVSNLKYWQDPIALLYGVRSIPAAFVLNKDGVIVAKNLRGAQLDAKIEELLNE